MSKAEYALLQDVIMDADFPDLDLALRRGRHVDRDDAAWYSLLTDAQELLEPFYRRYGCELIHKTDGYFYLLPTGDKVSRKQMAPTDMLVGQALALLYLDPAAVERGGVVSQEEIVGQLSAVLGSDALIGLFSPGKRKKQDERIAQRNVRQRVAEAVRRLAGLGFVELNDASAVRLRAALLRFAEPVRGLSEPAEALAKLVAQGEVALTPEEQEDSDEERDDADVDAEEADVTPLAAADADDLASELSPRELGAADSPDADLPGDGDVAEDESEASGEDGSRGLDAGAGGDLSGLVDAVATVSGGAAAQSDEGAQSGKRTALDIETAAASSSSAAVSGASGVASGDAAAVSAASGAASDDAAAVSGASGAVSDDAAAVSDASGVASGDAAAMSGASGALGGDAAAASGASGAVSGENALSAAAAAFGRDENVLGAEAAADEAVGGDAWDEDARAAERDAATGGDAWGADGRRDMGDDDASARDAWDGASESGVVARPDLEDAHTAADGGVTSADQGEQSAVDSPSAPNRASKPARRVTSDDDLDWADIVLPGQDAEEGS